MTATRRTGAVASSTVPTKPVKRKRARRPEAAIALDLWRCVLGLILSGTPMEGLLMIARHNVTALEAIVESRPAKGRRG